MIWGVFVFGEGRGEGRVRGLVRRISAKCGGLVRLERVRGAAEGGGVESARLESGGGRLLARPSARAEHRVRTLHSHRHPHSSQRRLLLCPIALPTTQVAPAPTPASAPAPPPCPIALRTSLPRPPRAIQRALSHSHFALCTLHFALRTLIQTRIQTRTLRSAPRTAFPPAPSRSMPSSEFLLA